MDLTLSPEQELLRDAARRFLASRSPPAEVRRLEADPRGYDPAVWKELAELGWLGLEIPEAQGGGGQTFVEAVLLLEEMGRALLPAPYLASAVLCADLVSVLGTPEQRARRLPPLAAGDAVAAPALAEPGWPDPRGAPALVARPRGDALELSGVKRFVPFAAQAQWLLVSVSGPGLALVERDAPGLSSRRQSTLGGDPVHEVCFEATPAERLGPTDPAPAAAALDRALDRGAVAGLARALGAAERALELSVEYAATRQQFGRPIGSFQAVAHRLVDARSDVDALRYLLYQAAWCLARGHGAAPDGTPDAALEVAAAHAYGTEALRRIFAHAHQVHGAIGFSTEHDLPLFTRLAKATEIGWGAAAASRERVATALGL